MYDLLLNIEAIQFSLSRIMYGIESWWRDAAVERPDGPAPTMITTVSVTRVFIFRRAKGGQSLYGIDVY